MTTTPIGSDQGTSGGRGPSRRPAPAGVVLVTAALVGVMLIVVGLYGSHSTPGRPVVAAATESPAAPRLADQPAPPAARPSAPATAPARQPDARALAGVSPLGDRAAAAPMRLLIPRIGVDAAVVPLATATDGSLQAPASWDDAGWWADGPKPGEQGPAVLAGHVDSTRGPAVFYRLGALHPGDQVTVVRRDATRASFTVNQIGEYPKDQFPTRQVYSPTRQAALRLVTCGGPFNQHTGHYQDNVIVYAVRSA